MISYEEGIEIYYNEGDTLPTEGIPFGSIALCVDTWATIIFNGTEWIAKQ